MKVSILQEKQIADLGHAFGYYDYGAEHGLIDAFPSRDAVAAFIRGYVRMAFRNGMLYATSENGEGYIVYKLPGQKVALRSMLPLAKAFFFAMSLREIGYFLWVMAKGSAGLDKQLDKEKKPYVFVGLVCVREKCQGQGYMRKVMDMAYAQGDRLGVPVILETDAKSKCDKYVHLGMELAGTRSFGTQEMLYDLIQYPKSQKGDATK